MKIAGTPPSPTAQPRRAEQPAARTTSFRALLAGGGDADQRAFGFSELGMFGAGGATREPAARPSVSRPTGAPPAAAETAAASPATPRPQAPSAHTRLAEMVRQAPLRTGLTGGDALRQVAAAGEPAATPEPLKIADDAHTRLAERASAADRPSLPVARRRLQASLEARGAMKVLVSGEGDDLKVVVAAVDDDPEAASELRRVAAEVAFDLGMTLTGFVLNGAEIDTRQPR